MARIFTRNSGNSMTSICIIDTSVFCNVLGIPNRAQRQQESLDQLKVFIEMGATLLLPMATIYETGNHIAQNGNGRMRRELAKKFIEQVQQAFSGEAPWTPTPMQALEEIVAWLNEFPDWAMRGAGFGDLSIFKVYEEQCALHAGCRVFIWSYDQHLAAYDRPAQI
ncbi:MAG: hypothetical protein KC413_15220 [Anaerolineales bacterium]|nr:hypothetical protein [Anaerolineales bacterium]